MSSTADTQVIAKPSAAAAVSLTNPRLYAFALAISIVPLWLGEYLPMVDLPGHAAMLTAIREMTHQNESFTAEFRLDWYSPYLTGLALFYALSSILPITVAAKVVVSLSVVLTSMFTGTLLREVGADARWKWLAIPGSYSFGLYWGFFSYIAAVPVALWLLVATVRFDRSPTIRSGVGVAALTLLAFFSHIIAMGFACLCALCYIAGARYSDFRGVMVRWLPYTAPLPLIALWFTRSSEGIEGFEDAPYVYGLVSARLPLIVSQTAGFDHVSVFGVVMTAAVLALPALSGARLCRRPERWLPFAVGLAVYFAFPSFAYRTGFVYERLAVFLVPLWLMMWDARDGGRGRGEWLAMFLVVVWVGLNTARFAGFAHETRAFDAVLERMEPGKRVAAFVVDNGSRHFANPVYLHFVSWYQAVKGGIVDFNFADFQSVVQRPDTAAPRVDETVAWAPWLFDWQAHGGSRYDYFLVRAGANFAPLIFKDRLNSVELIAQTDLWWLYRNLETPAGETAPVPPDRGTAESNLDSTSTAK
jgi:hypothetical protein